MTKNSNGDNVSNFHDWEGNREDPNEQYPLDMRFRAVLVAEGAEFVGWGKFPQTKALYPETVLVQEDAG